MVAAARERAAALGLSSRTAGTDRFTPGDPRRDVEPFPDERELITRWVVAEMNAARGATAVPGQPGGPPLPSRLRRVLRRSWRRSAPGFGPPPEHVSAGAFGPGEGRFADHLGPHPDDIADPHVLGGELHSLAFEQIRSSTDSLIRLLREVHERT